MEQNGTPAGEDELILALAAGGCIPAPRSRARDFNRTATRQPVLRRNRARMTCNPVSHVTSCDSQRLASDSRFDFCILHFDFSFPVHPS
jgi:hypothetical protein